MPSLLGGVTELQHAVAAVGGGIVPRGSREAVFNQIFGVFLALGTLVGIVVIGYMLYNVYKYRDHGDEGSDADRPELGEIPQGGGGGRKLFLSFALSAIIVISLITWTYFTLLYVESGGAAADAEDALTVHVQGYRFGWQYTYPNGATTGTLRVPEDRPVRLVVTSADVFHNFGIAAFHVKTDAIPGQTTDTWFVPDEQGQYLAQCYELCGAGHSFMQSQVIVMPPTDWQAWYQNTTATNQSSAMTPPPTITTPA
ncbi:MAG: cytochrome c oxidase subunit II [Halobacteriaceae archaeon]